MKLILSLSLAILLSGCAFKVGYTGSGYYGSSQRTDEEAHICYPCFYVGDYVIGLFSDYDSYFGNIKIMERR